MQASHALVALCALAALLTGGCSTDYQGPSKADFVAKANAACASNGADVKSGLDELLNSGGEPTQGELRSFVGDVAVPSLQARVDMLRTLEPPAADRKQVDAFILAYQKAIDRIANDPTSFTDGDPFIDAHTAADAYGLTTCAR